MGGTTTRAAFSLGAGLMALLSTIAAPASWLNDADRNRIDDRIDAMGDPGAVIDVIVDFGHRLTLDDLSFLGGFTPVSPVPFPDIHAVSVPDVTVGDVPYLVERFCVTMVELAEPVHAELDVATRAVKARPGLYSPDTAWEEGFQGSGINIAILDTGVDDGHPAFAGDYVAGYDGFLDTDTNPDDDQTGVWHGTHCAGIALNHGEVGDQTFMGTAPDARLLDVKVLDAAGNGTFTSVMRGLQWCIDNRNTAWAGQAADHAGIDVVSMSLSTGTSSDGEDALSRLVNTAAAQGLVVAAAAGNDFGSGWMPSPAASDGAIAVAAVVDTSTVARGDDHHADYSNQGPRADDGDGDQMDEFKPDVAAPGGSIWSASHMITSTQGSAVDQNGAGYHDLSGTSMATPCIAGVAGLVLEAYPGFTPQDVKNVLHCTAEDWNGTHDASLDPKYDPTYGWGIVDAHAAVTVEGCVDPWITPWGDPPGSPPPWKTPDIWLQTEPATVGQANRIHARVHNTGIIPALDVTVEFKVAYYGAGQSWIYLGEDTRDVPAGGTTDFQLDWTPAHQGHTCLRAQIEFADDACKSNNMAMDNNSIQPASKGTLTFDFRVYNTTDSAEDVALCLDRLDLPADWLAELSGDLFSLAPGDSVDVTLTVTTGTPTAVPVAVHVAAIPRGEIRARPPWGGITAEIAPGLSDAGGGPPDRHRLLPAHPNPFNAGTELRFELAGPCRVDLAVYDLQGRRIRTLVAEHRPAGPHTARWDGRDDAGRAVAGGMYCVHMRAGDATGTQKLLLVK